MLGYHFLESLALTWLFHAQFSDFRFELANRSHDTTLQSIVYHDINGVPPHSHSSVFLGTYQSPLGLVSDANLMPIYW